MLLLSSTDFVFKITFFPKILSENNQCHSLDPDQDRHSVGPDLDPNCLLKLSADDKS